MPSDITEDIKVPHFQTLIHEFFQHQVGLPPAKQLDLSSKINIYTSAIAIFHAPSDIYGIHGMAREQVHVTPRWGKFQVPHYNMTFVVTNPDIPGMGGLDIARVKFSFSFEHCNRTYPCALVHWFSKIGEEPDVNTGMWQVEPDFDAEGEPLHAVIHIDTMIHAVHLLSEPDGPLSASVTYVSAPDLFVSFYMLLVKSNWHG